jgi:DNA polymerase V
VAVLSNNDGCIVARSNEVKALGVPMGVPYFQVKDLLTEKQVTLFSGNFALYGDISKRVMSIIERVAGDIEIYSIDEAFVSLGSDESRAVALAKDIKRAVEMGTGVPVSVGVALTKTLAKLAGEKAKKEPEHKGVFLITEENRLDLLRETDIADIWGVGGQTSRKLREYGVTTALALASSSAQWIRATLGIGGLRIAKELSGEKMRERDSHDASSKSILSSRSFGKKTFLLKDLEESVASHTTSASRKMRAQGSGAGFISVFIRSARRGSVRGVTVSGFRALLSPTTDTLTLIGHAHDILSEIYTEGVRYEKAGILLSNLTPIENIPASSLFEELTPTDRTKLMQALDAIDKKYGKNTVFPAAIGIQGKQSWSLKREFHSPPVTTSWEHIPTVKA